MLRFYQVDLLDFYRGTLSPRRLGVLVRQLPRESATVRAMGDVPLSRSEHFLADLWSLWAKQDHPVRAKIVAEAHHAEKAARVIELKAKYQARKRKYGIGVVK